MNGAIQTLLEAEASANAILEEAEEVGKELRRLSETQAWEMAEALRLEIQDEAEAIIRDARQEAMERAEEIIAENRDQLAIIAQQTAHHRALAIKMVVARVLGGRV